jgi:hypothetical protein
MNSMKKQKAIPKTTHEIRALFTIPMICVASRFGFGRLRFPAEWPAPSMIPWGLLDGMGA